ncbi:MAG TPA: sensor histidine kinase [Candidatus Limnocylindrales bacterium]
MTAGSKEIKGFGLAFLVTVNQLVGAAIASRGQEAGVDLLGFVLLAASGLLLILRLRFPLAAAVTVTASSVAYLVLDYPSGTTYAALIVLALSLIKNRHHAVAWDTGAAGFAAWALLSGATLGQILVMAAWVAGLGGAFELLHLAGRIVDRMQAEERRAIQERQLRQASEERLLIAQELHDVLGHHLSLINVRAGVGRHLMDREPEQARAALDTIKQASAEALREVRSVLEVLYPQGHAALRAPAPRLEHLDELTVDAGLPVATTISGQPRPLAAEIDRAAYRIVQEALTNVRRHAGPDATASIVIDYRPEDRLLVRVDDDGGLTGVAVTRADDGNGISGMRERATSLGGTLTAGPLPDGGWRVEAEFPLPPMELEQ